jgi:hypothetical protein
LKLPEEGAEADDFKQAIQRAEQSTAMILVYP